MIIIDSVIFAGCVMEEKIRKYKFINSILIFAACVIIYASTVSGANIDKRYFYGYFAAIPFAYGIIVFYDKIKKTRNLIMLKANWGKKVECKRDMAKISKLFKYIENEKNSGFTIDDQTYEDLNMNEIFALLDRTHTIPGENMLYKILRTPLFDETALYERNEIIKTFEQNKQIREDIQLDLFNMGKERQSYLLSLLWDEIESETKNQWLYRLMALAAVASFASIIFLGAKAIVLFIAPVQIANSYIHYKAKERIGGELSSVGYLDAMLRTCYSIAHKNYKIPGEKQQRIKELSQKCEDVSKKIGKFFFSTNSSINELSQFASAIFLSEERKFCSVIHQIIKNREDLRELYNLLGEMDALMSIASYRSGIKKYTEPKLFKASGFINAVNIGHPLIEDPVTNSVTMKDRGILVTGSNMSGKSTFLRTVGINAVFAQTICTCIADEYSASYLRVITSISRLDNIIGGKSYYLAEAEALLRIINEFGKEIPVLCIVDEIFRGTNSIERINASIEILNYLAKGNGLTIVATHDLELSEHVDGYYQFFHFSESVGTEGLSFDYTLKEGVSKTRNAVKIMEYLGYPEEVVKKTRERVALAQNEKELQME